ncbi:MAG: PBP1A family penicillin-binding protein, partial [Bacillota bacterium]|nr:PBP1A family penicillin-binding protein [Bacillota bacterium]
MSESQNRRRTSDGMDGVRKTSRRKSSQNPNGKTRKKRRRKSSGGKIGKVILILAVIIGFAVAGAALGTVFGILQSTDMLNTSDVMPDSYTSVIYDDKGNAVDKLHGSENREYVKLSQITTNMQNAVVAIEDQRFYEHNGIDMKGIMRAMVENIKSMDFSQGASTITQQVIKNEVLTNEKSLTRKIKEQYLAISLESALEKQLGSKEAAKKYILELYLNTIALHHGLHGVEAAAQYYFGKHASELTLAESALIAGITKHPSRYAPDVNEEASRERQMLVLDKMLELEMITKEQYEQAVEEDVFGHLVCVQRAEEQGNAKHNWFVDAAVQQIKADLVEKKHMSEAQASNLIYSGGLQIHTTMNSSMQATADAAMRNDDLFPAGDGSLDVTYLISVLDTENPDDGSNQAHYERKATVYSQEEADAFVEGVKEELLDDTHVLVLDKLTISRSLQAAMVIMDQYTGEIKALVGGRGEKPGDAVFNRATQALRQQGSTMKPLASYAPAIDTGLMMPGSVILDEEISIGGYSPKNWDGKYIGPTTVRQGIWHSMNVLAVKTFVEVGAETSYKYLMDFGFTTIDERDKAATTALGGLTQGVSVLEQTAAYATIANGGTYYEPVYYTVVYDHDGNVLLDNEDQVSRRVLKETTAYMLTDMMRDVISRGTGGQAGISGMNVSGKTGTTNDTIDLTFYGYTPYYTGGIWMGYDTQKEIKNAGNAHLKIWKNVMTKIHADQGLANKSFAKPEGLTTLAFCSATGMAPTDVCALDYYGKTTHNDLAVADFERGGVCDKHSTYIVCKESGKIAAPTCPVDCQMEVVLAVDGDKILSKPGTIPEGKMDIVINEVCDMVHEQVPVIDPNMPFDPLAPIDPNAPGGVVAPSDPTIPPAEGTVTQPET